MIRITLLQVASFLLPFVLFFLWRLQTSSEAALKPTPVLKLSAAGAGLAVLSMIGLVVFDSLNGGHAGDCYIPPQVVDGEIQPGYFTDGECETIPGDEPRAL
ncbi:MAG: hypothetical protein GYB36_02800 [Alphaproteobacteria bacterium]|nr:hypothetical protein [Alphaproteobacteria bacterium]